MNADGLGREATQMSRLIILSGATPDLVEARPAIRAEVKSFPEHCSDHESLTIPNRGILFGSLLSGVLWAVLILVAREVWLYLH
jgi:hypothetical protein